MEKIIKILIKRDNMSYEEALVLLNDVKEMMEECGYDPDECETIFMEELGLEPDYMPILLLDK